MTPAINPFKEEIHKHCQEILTSRLAALNKTLQDLAESVSNETKSTAGDKYETARAMLHIEQDHVRHQIQELNAQLSVLNSIDPSIAAKQIVLGSLIQTENAFFYLSTSLGKIRIHGKTVFVLSMQSPLGKTLIGLSEGGTFPMNGGTQRVIAIL